ncbi:dTDP-4-dehydrorhamnose reductase rfbD ortholog [Clostridium sp. CAG:780]|nr:dTDP-4-dehydrorhamnose reductase rfbD ortholog [Clostridium sp. CAG:780]
MKILITGANGMLAKAVKEELKENELVCTDVEELDITNLDAVRLYTKKVKPDYIINCAAYTAVDKAEEQEELVYKINAIGPKNLAIATQENNAVLVHISTDYVFGGDKDTSKDYNEDDKKNPQAVYGKTKLAGEKFIEENCKKFYIFRTAWLYGEGHNFVRTMINLSKEHDEVKVVNDQHGSPTYAVDLASIIHQAMEKQIPFGVYNSTNMGYTTWYDFTKMIYDLEGINCKVTPVTSEEFKSAAKRPKNSQMSKSKLLKYGIKIPTYEDALKRYLKIEQEKNN